MGVYTWHLHLRRPIGKVLWLFSDFGRDELAKLGLMFSRVPTAHVFRRVSVPTSGLWPHFCGYNQQLQPFAKPPALSSSEGWVLGHVNMDVASHTNFNPH